MLNEIFKSVHGKINSKITNSKTNTLNNKPINLSPTHRTQLNLNTINIKRKYSVSVTTPPAAADVGVLPLIPTTVLPCSVRHVHT